MNLMKKAKLITVGILAAISIAALTGCGNSSVNTANSASGNGKTITIAMTNAWGSLNPYASSGNYADIIADQLYDRLWVSKKDGTVQPRLAESYEVSPDHTYMTVHLNKNAKFHDGKPVTADDVVFSAQLDGNPQFKSAKRNQLQYIAGTTDGGAALSKDSVGIEKIDEYTVKIKFKQPMNELPILTMFNRYFYVVPKHIYGSKTIEELNNAETWKASMIGSGPFKFSNVIDGERVEFVKNNEYFLGAPDIDRLTIRVLPGSQLLAGLKSGEIDILAGGGIASLPLSDWGAAKEDANLEAVAVKNYGYQAMIMNMTSSKLNNPTIRKGISTAINRQAIVDNLLHGEASTLYAPFSNDHPFVDESKLKLPIYNPQEAKRLLEEGGFDFSQTLELIVPTGNEARIQSTVLIQQDLEAIGVKTHITQYDFSTLMDKMRKGNYDLGMCGSADGIEPSDSSSWLSNKSPVNFPCVPDDRFLVLFNEAKSKVDLAEEKEAYVKVWQAVLDEAPIAYLYSDKTLFAYNKNKLSNIDPTLFGQINWAVWTWKVKQ